MRAEDYAALAAKGTIEMYCRDHDCTSSCVFYDEFKEECCLADAPHFWSEASEEAR